MTERTGSAQRIDRGITASIASLFAWSLDLFDLFIVIYVAPYVGRAFFSFENANWSMSAAYLSFSVTLIVRPFGSALFGHFADTYGRKGSMVVTVSTRRYYVFSTRLLAVPWGAVGGTPRHLKLNEYS
jgi:MFS family permease